MLFHTVLSAILVGSTWWHCYWAASSLAIDKMPRSALLNSLVTTPFISDGIKRRACNSLAALEKASRRSKLVAYLERKMPSLDPTRLCVSYAEAKVGRLLFKPLTIPCRIWLSWKLTKLWQQRFKTNEKRIEMSGLQGDEHTLSASLSCNNHLLRSTSIDKRSNRILTRKCNQYIQNSM